MKRKPPSDREGRWLLIHCGDDNRPHVMLRSESARHTASASCPCGTRLEAGVVMHTVLTAAHRPQRPIRGEQFWH